MKQAPDELRNTITFWLWGIILVPLSGLALGLTLAALGFGISMIRQGVVGEFTAPAVPTVPSSWQGLVIIAAVAVPVLIFAILVRYTWGGAFVDETVESVEEYSETVTNDGGEE